MRGQGPNDEPGKSLRPTPGQGHQQPRGRILYRLWKYMGRSRLLLVLALALSFSSSLLALYGPKLSGEAINAIVVNLTIQPVGSVEKVYITITMDA